MRHDEVRIGPQRRFVLCNGVVAPAKAAEHVAEIVAGAGTVGTQCDRALRMGQRFGQPVHILKQRGQMQVPVDKIGALRNGASVVALGLRLSARPFQRRGQIEMRDRGVGSAFHDLLKLHQRLVEASQRAQSAPEIVARLGIAGVKRHGPLEAGYRVRKRSIGCEDHAPVVVGLGETRIERHRPADKRRRVGAPQLMGGDAPKVERARVVGIVVADSAVKVLGVGQTTGAMMSNRSCHRLL
ncbi:MAG: hypothetical protein NVSMB20_03400 [Bradyrhizobium sp.]